MAFGDGEEKASAAELVHEDTELRLLARPAVMEMDASERASSPSCTVAFLLRPNCCILRRSRSNFFSAIGKIINIYYFSQGLGRN